MLLELLRRSAEHTLVVLIQVAFTRYYINNYLNKIFYVLLII